MPKPESSDTYELSESWLTIYKAPDSCDMVKLDRIVSLGVEGATAHVYSEGNMYFISFINFEQAKSCATSIASKIDEME